MKKKFIVGVLVLAMFSVATSVFAITYFKGEEVNDPSWIIDNGTPYPARVFKIEDKEDDVVCYVAARAQLAGPGISCVKVED